jgi:hypothetical protein
VLRYNKTGELKLDSAALSEFQHIVGLPGKFVLAAIPVGTQEQRIDYSVHCSCYGEKYPFRTSEYFASVVQRS